MTDTQTHGLNSFFRWRDLPGRLRQKLGSFGFAFGFSDFAILGVLVEQVGGDRNGRAAVEKACGLQVVQTRQVDYRLKAEMVKKVRGRHPGQRPSRRFAAAAR